jgi:hypothetical protein
VLRVRNERHRSSAESDVQLFVAGDAGAERSWEHCYRYFRRVAPNLPKTDRDHAALQLGFYLASWGMYRGSSFLLQYADTAHLGVIDTLASPEFLPLWQHEFGPTEDGVKLLPKVVGAINAVREAYRPFAPASEARAGGLRYPLMKLVDMYFWQIGFELDEGNSGSPGVTVV